MKNLQIYLAILGALFSAAGLCVAILRDHLSMAILFYTALIIFIHAAWYWAVK